MAVQATCYGDPSSDCVLLLQHRGIQSAKHSAAAAAAALTPDTIGDCSIRMVAGDASNGTALPSSPLPASAAAADQPGAAKSSLTDGRADVVAKADTQAGSAALSGGPSSSACGRGAGGGGVCSVVVGSRAGPAEALALTGALALQALLLGGDDPCLAQHFQAVRHNLKDLTGPCFSNLQSPCSCVPCATYFTTRCDWKASSFFALIMQ